MGRLLSWSERPAHDRMVPGSNPGRPTSCGDSVHGESQGLPPKKESVRKAMAGRERTAEAVKQTAIGGEAGI